MRRDILELDHATTPLIRDMDLKLDDVEAIRLLLGTGSVVDWQRVHFTDVASVDRYLATLLLDMSDPNDVERLRYVYNEAVSYLEEMLKLRFPEGMRDPEDVREVFLLASQWGGFRRKQILACVTLKLMHVIHHMEAADLRFKSPISEAELFDLAEARILKTARRMREDGLPIVSFYGSRKSRNSVITKLLAKKESIAATIFDKLRFRIVVERQEDLIPVLTWMVRHFIPFNYAIPGEAHNNLVDPETLLENIKADQQLRMQTVPETWEVDTTGKNEFSGASYRMINFITDFPVRLPDSLPGRFSFELGQVVFVMIEFQLLDEETTRDNEEGENAHHLYKERQYQEVARRLKRGRFRKRGKE